MIQLDHIVVAASTLEHGSQYLEKQLAVPLSPGGQHLGFGTHNRLLHLGSDVYLELIAVDPAQTELHHPIPFGLGTIDIQRSLITGPRLIAWVTSTLDMSKALLSDQDKIGKVVKMSRGDLNWTIRQRADARPVSEGLPTIIDWGATAHPCTRLPDVGVRLSKLNLSVSVRAHSSLKQAFNDPRVFIKPAQRPAIRAELQLQSGRRVFL